VGQFPSTDRHRNALFRSNALFRTRGRGRNALFRTRGRAIVSSSSCLRALVLCGRSLPSPLPPMMEAERARRLSRSGGREQFSRRSWICSSTTSLHWRASSTTSYTLSPGCNTSHAELLPCHTPPPRLAHESPVGQLLSTRLCGALVLYTIE